MPRRPRRNRERGAAAVEFAIVVPLLLALVLGIVEFSRIYNVQIVVTNAAREGARTMAIKDDTGLATAAVNNAVTNVTLSSIQITPGTGACTNGAEANATVTSNVALLTGPWFNIGSSITVTGTGAMRCGG